MKNNPKKWLPNFWAVARGLKKLRRNYMAHNRKEQENSTIFALLLFFVAICQTFVKIERT
nr:MAG TPA: hypothetical protein [Caudoviricetes sp.]